MQSTAFFYMIFYIFSDVKVAIYFVQLLLNMIFLYQINLFLKVLVKLCEMFVMCIYHSSSYRSVRSRPDFRPLFLFRILLLRFLFYSIFNTSDCRFPLFCCPRKIRSERGQDYSVETCEFNVINKSIN